MNNYNAWELVVKAMHSQKIPQDKIKKTLSEIRNSNPSLNTEFMVQTILTPDIQLASDADW